MSSQHPIPVVLLVVGAACLALTLWFSIDALGPAAPGPALASAPSTAPAPSTSPLDPVDDAPPAAGESQRTEAPRTFARSSAAATPKARVILSGEVHADGRAVGGAQVRVAPYRISAGSLGRRTEGAGVVKSLGTRASPPARGVDEVLRPMALGTRYPANPVHLVDERGRFESDVTALPLAGPLDALAIELRVGDSPPLEYLLESPLADELPGDGARRELRATLFVPMTCDVVGSVIVPLAASRPPLGTPTASVAAFEWVDGRPAVSAVRNAECERSSGEFALRLECGRDYVVVAIADGCRPWSKLVRTRELLARHEIVLERGESIAGRAQVGGEPVRGAVRARFKHAAAAEYVQCCIGGRWLVWTGAGFEWESQGVGARADGRFEIFGLAQAPYTLEVGNVTNAYATTTVLAEVTAPAGGVALGLRVCRLDLHVFDDGEPAANRSLQICELAANHATNGAHRTDANGVATLWVDPARTTSIALAPSERDAPSKPSQRIECRSAGASLALRVDF